MYTLLLEFVLVQFSWYSWGALPNEFTCTSSTKTNVRRGVSSLTETENRRIYEKNNPQISEKPIIHEN